MSASVRPSATKRFLAGEREWIFQRQRADHPAGWRSR
jgi:hypothetical protein